MVYVLGQYPTDKTQKTQKRESVGGLERSRGTQPPPPPIFFVPKPGHMKLKQDISFQGGPEAVESLRVRLRLREGNSRTCVKWHRIKRPPSIKRSVVKVPKIIS